MKCIKCYGNFKSHNEFVCESCKEFGKLINIMYDEAKKIFMESTNPEKEEIYNILLNTFFIIQNNPKITIYKNIINNLFQKFYLNPSRIITLDEIWIEVRSSRNIKKIIKRMEECQVIKLSNDQSGLNLNIEMGAVMKNLMEKIYLIYKGERESELRVAAVLTMYVILYELLKYANDNTKEDIYRDFESHSPRMVWVATKFLWNEGIKNDETFSDTDITKYLSKHGLTSKSIITITSGLKETNPDSVQRYIADLDLDSNGDINFVINHNIYIALERLNHHRMREHE